MASEERIFTEAELVVLRYGRNTCCTDVVSLQRLMAPDFEPETKGRYADLRVDLKTGRYSYNGSQTLINRSIYYQKRDGGLIGLFSRDDEGLTSLAFAVADALRCDCHGED